MLQNNQIFDNCFACDQTNLRPRCAFQILEKPTPLNISSITTIDGEWETRYVAGCYGTCYKCCYNSMAINTSNWYKLAYQVRTSLWQKHQFAVFFMLEYSFSSKNHGALTSNWNSYILTLREYTYTQYSAFSYSLKLVKGSYSVGFWSRALELVSGESPIVGGAREPDKLQEKLEQLTGEQRTVNFYSSKVFLIHKQKKNKFQQDTQTTKVIMNVFQMIHWLSDWVIEWLIVWLIDWLIDWQKVTFSYSIN